MQLVVDLPAQIEFIEVYTDLMGLLPLNQTLETKPDFLKIAADTAAALSPIKALTTIVEKLEGERERVNASHELTRLARRFIMYRFINDKGQRGIEWLLTKDLLAEWGPLLRGSAYLSFHGTPKRESEEEEKAVITLCPRLGFLEGDSLCYVPAGQPPELTISMDVPFTRE